MESIYSIFGKSAKTNAEKTCLIYLGQELKYAELSEAIDRVAASVAVLGIKPGARAILYLPNLPQWIMTWFALQKIGAIPVPITPAYGPSDLEYIANDCGAEMIFCLDTNFGYVTRVRSKTRLKHVIVTTVVETLPLWKQWLGRALDKVPKGKFYLDEHTLAFTQLLKPRHGRAISEPCEQSETLVILYTGGTTGHPKGVPISPEFFSEAMHAQRKNSERIIPRGEDVLLQGAPLYHILGEVLGAGALLNGERLILLPRLNLDAMFDHIQRYRVKSFVGVPAMYRMILEHDRLDQYDLSSLIYCFSGGDVLPGELAQRWLRKLGQPIYNGYGATEVSGGIALTPVGESFPQGTAGKIVPHLQTRIVDPVTLEPVPDGEPGELLVSSAHMVRRYWNNPAETEKSFLKIDGTLWYRTGDIVSLDAKGWLFFQDRSADVIKHKGYRVAAARVEARLLENPAVIAAVVVGVPDKNIGERIKAFVVLKEDIKGITAYSLINWCRETLASYEVPHYIEFRDMLPKSKVGKLLRRELRAEERRKMGTN